MQTSFKIQDSILNSYNHLFVESSVTTSSLYIKVFFLSILLNILWNTILPRFEGAHRAPEKLVDNIFECHITVWQRSHLESCKLTSESYLINANIFYSYQQSYFVCRLHDNSLATSPHIGVTDWLVAGVDRFHHRICYVTDVVLLCCCAVVLWSGVVVTVWSSNSYSSVLYHAVVSWSTLSTTLILQACRISWSRWTRHWTMKSGCSLKQTINVNPTNKWKFK